MKQFLKYNFFQIVITFEIRLHGYLQNTWQEDYLIKETKDPFLHGDFDSMDMFTRVTVENALLCFTTPNTKRDSVTPKKTWIRFRCTTEWLANFYPERPENSSPVSPGHRSKMAARRPWSFFLEMNLTPERSHFLQNFRLHLIDLSRRLERMLMKMLLTMCCFGCTKLRWYHLSSLAASVDLDVFNEVQTSMLVQKGQYIKIYLYTSR